MGDKGVFKKNLQEFFTAEFQQVEQERQEMAYAKATLLFLLFVANSLQRRIFKPCRLAV